MHGHGTVRCGIAWYSIEECCTMWYRVVSHNMVVWDHAMLCGATVGCSELCALRCVSYACLLCRGAFFMICTRWPAVTWRARHLSRRLGLSCR